MVRSGSISEEESIELPMECTEKVSKRRIKGECKGFGLSN